MGGDGVIHVTWDESSNWYSANVFYSRSTDDGQTWSAPFKITSGTYNNRGRHSDVAADNLGRVYAVFHYVPTRGAAEVSARVSSDSGANWNPPFNLTSNSVPDSRPGIYCRPDGSYVDIVFRRLEAEAWSIRHIYSKDGLATWSDSVQISNPVGGDGREAVVVRGANLNIFAFWEDVVNLQGGYEVFYNRFLY